MTKQRTKKDPLLIKSNMLEVIRKANPLEAAFLDTMLIEGRAIVTDKTHDQIMEDLKLRYDPEVITRWESHQGPDQFLTRVPHLVGMYNSSDLAKTIVGRLIDEGLPVLVGQLPIPLPYAQIIGDADGNPVHGHTGPVWVIRTDYPQGHEKRPQGT